MAGNWNYNSTDNGGLNLKAEDAALGIADPYTAAKTLAAQTIPLSVPAADVGIGDIQGELLPTGEWLKISARAAGTPTTTGDMTDPINIAITAVALCGSKAGVIAADKWAKFLQLLAALQSVGDVSQATYDTINGLAVMTAPKFQPAPTTGDIQTARAQ